ncbi:CPBP family intramembrane glutamic endopeptidase [Ichthyenterobacterium sp. W332]|uniref:CPBP family intramembrane glutamic endopeptidase n=1 Tax=Microcosmobacter mediterraneus TaxID=3075607 RepID=A0ABU2YMR0_9FLAO|nr:CPBP family intramembrane glutamic endopeptidase [Ichthyenterobacterium sp. W332]MDT0559426.1 CPBP family intramembrane glutamic endopeptidase [Ichthyenterobacterium sp. W332]
MYIAQVYKVLHDWWRYIIGTILVITGVFIFSIPHVVAIVMKGDADFSRLSDIDYLMSLFEPNLNFVFLLLPFLGGLIALFFAIRLLHGQTITSLTTARPKIDWKRIWFAFFFWGIVSVGLAFIDILGNPEDYKWNFDIKSFAILAVIAIVLVPIQTSCEEYLFRGYLMQGIGVLVKNKWVPLLITSAVFGLLHISNPEVDKLGPIIMIYYIGTGLFLGIITLMDDGLELAIGFHAANNLFTALLVTADWTAFQTHSIYKDLSDPSVMGFTEIIIPVFVIFPILILIFAKKYKWNNWYERLLGKVEKPLEDNYKVLD